MIADEHAEGPFEPVVPLPSGSLCDLPREILEAEPARGEGPPGKSEEMPMDTQPPESSATMADRPSSWTFVWATAVGHWTA